MNNPEEIPEGYEDPEYAKKYFVDIVTALRNLPDSAFEVLFKRKLSK